jgi:predicted lipoprotein with Yx(FWY)xxD motif
LRSLRIYALIGFCALSLVLLAACGTTQPSASGSGSAPAYSSTTPTASGSTSTGDVVKTTSLTVGGKQVSVLTDAKGMTLYTFKPDTATTTACTGSCATIWTPLLFTGTGTPTGATGLTAVKDSLGNQVQSSGHFLYTYSGDSAPGQANGEGSGGQWFVAMADGSVDPAAAAPASNGY